MDKIVSKVEYSKKVLRDLNRNHFKYDIRVAKWIINVIAILDITSNILLISLGSYEYYTPRIIFGQFLVLALVIFCNTNIFADISTYFFLKTDKISLGLKSEMTFQHDKISVVNESEMMTLSYDKLYKIMETKEYIYLYLNKMQALIVTKENTSESELELLRNILKENVKKYIVYMK